jgi:hypothetical protein
MAAHSASATACRSISASGSAAKINLHLNCVATCNSRSQRQTLKVPKREIFVTELIILSHPIWIGDLRTKAKNRFVRIVRLLFAILVFFSLTECALKNIPRLLRERKNYATCTEYAVKNLLRVLSMR